VAGQGRHRQILGGGIAVTTVCVGKKNKKGGEKVEDSQQNKERRRKRKETNAKRGRPGHTPFRSREKKDLGEKGAAAVFQKRGQRKKKSSIGRVEEQTAGGRRDRGGEKREGRIGKSPDSGPDNADQKNPSGARKKTLGGGFQTTERGKQA